MSEEKPKKEIPPDIIDLLGKTTLPPSYYKLFPYMGAERIMNSREAAKYLGISKVTLYKLIKNGTIPAKRIGKEWRLAKTALDEIIREGEK